MKTPITYLCIIICLLAGFHARAQDDAFEDGYGSSYGETATDDYDEDLVVFSDDDNPGSGEEGGGSVEDPEAPIDDYLPWLALAGIGLGYYLCRGRKVKA